MTAARITSGQERRRIYDQKAIRHSRCNVMASWRDGFRLMGQRGLGVVWLGEQRGTDVLGIMDDGPNMRRPIASPFPIFESKSWTFGRRASSSMGGWMAFSWISPGEAFSWSWSLACAMSQGRRGRAASASLGSET